MVNAMRTGKLFVIYVGSHSPDFINEWTGDDDKFPTSKIFNRAVWKDHDTYMKCVKDGETHNDMGNAGAFYQDEKFGICILSKFTDLATCKSFCEKVPN